MKKQWMKKRKALCSLAVACLFTFTVASAVSNAETISFDEFAATNNKVAIQNEYSGVGVTFGGDNAGTGAGFQMEIPGTLGSEWNERACLPRVITGRIMLYTYVTTIFFNTSVTSFSFDVSRSNGSMPGRH